MTVVETRTAPVADGERIVVTAVKALASATETPLDEPPLLSEFIDPDALLRLFQCAHDGLPTGLTVTIPVETNSLRLTATTRDTVTIEVIDRIEDTPSTDTSRDPAAGEVNP